MPDKYDFEERGRLLVSTLATLASLCGGADHLPKPEDLAGTFEMLRDQAARLHDDGMAFAFPQG